jgi:flagellar FliL protein
MAEATEKTEVVAKQQGGSNVLLIIVVVMLFLILIGGAAAAYFMLSEDTAVIEEANKVEKSAPVAQQTQSANPMQQSSAPQKRVTNYAEIGPMYPMDKFIVNLYTEGSDRYIKTSINFELGSEELSAELDLKQPLIRDIVIKTLSAKTYEEISTIRGKENLKDDIVMQVNQVLSDGQVNNIFFTDFVIQ